MSIENWMDDTRQWFAEQANSKLIVAALIIIGALYLAFGNTQGRDYHLQVAEEKELARFICENSRNWVFRDLNRLKLGKSELKDIKINGKTIELEFIDYPKVLFLDSGISRINKRGSTASDLYCFFEDPRSGGEKFYYNYDTRQWVDKVRFRR